MPGLRLTWGGGDVPVDECDHDVKSHPYADAVCWRCGGVKPNDNDS